MRDAFTYCGYCNGNGHFGAQREHCHVCGGSGFVPMEGDHRIIGPDDIEALDRAAAADVAIPDTEEGMTTLLDTVLAIQHTARGIAEHLHHHGPCTMREFEVLHRLAQGPCSMGELAEAIGILPSGITGKVDNLERKGYVARSNGVTQYGLADRRSTLVTITDAGIAAYLAAERVTKDALTMTRHWNHDDIAEFRRDLNDWRPDGHGNGHEPPEATRP
jgi:DNA-binding MarR family transcriptional regulator